MKLPPPSPTITYDHLELLTNQENHVLKLAINEYSCKEMAETLGISPKTVEKHRKNIIKKFGIEGKVAFRKALKQVDRLLPLPER